MQDGNREKMTKKREREEEPGGDEAARPKKLSKKELREQAILRARQSMQADKQRVEAVKAKTKAVATPGESAKKAAPGSEQKAISKKQAREEAILRAKEYGAKDKVDLMKKKADSSRSSISATPQAKQPVAAAAAP